MVTYICVSSVHDGLFLENRLERNETSGFGNHHGRQIDDNGRVARRFEIGLSERQRHSLALQAEQSDA